MKKFILSILGILVFIHGIFGEAPKSLPIGSRQALQAFALQSVRSVEAGIGSQSIVGNNNQPYISKKVSNGLQALDVIRKANFSYTVENPQDTVSLYVNILDEDGSTILYGNSTKKTTVFGPGFYKPVDTDIKLYYQMDNISIPFPEAYAANAFVRNDKGETIRQDNLRVKNGKIFFPAGLVGQVSVRVFTADASGKGAQYLYAKDGGLKQSIDMVSFVGMTPTVDNTVFVTDADLNNAVIKSQNGFGDNTLYVVTLNKARNLLLFAKTTEGAYCNGFSIMKAGDTKPASWPIPKGYEVAQNLTDGVYYIWFSWDPKDFTEYKIPYAVPGDGYGKGFEENPTY